VRGVVSVGMCSECSECSEYSECRASQARHDAGGRLSEVGGESPGKSAAHSSFPINESTVDTRHRRPFNEYNCSGAKFFQSAVPSMVRALNASGAQPAGTGGTPAAGADK
jgi:hypothetical protein